MPDEDIVQEDTTNLPTEEVVNTTEVEEPTAEVETEDAEQLKEKNVKLFERAKKAEAELKALKAQVKPREVSTPSNTSLTQSVREFKAVADLPIEDAEFVANYAEKFGITMTEARKNKDIQAVLNVRAEERKTAEATATGTTRRSAAKVSDEQLLENASSGNIPDSEEALMRIAEARLKRKL